MNDTLRKGSRFQDEVQAVRGKTLSARTGRSLENGKEKKEIGLLREFTGEIISRDRILA
jgi:hypothetical protein